MDWTQFKQTLCDDLRPNALDVMNPYVTINAVMPMVEYQAAELERLKAELELRDKVIEQACKATDLRLMTIGQMPIGCPDTRHRDADDQVFAGCGALGRTFLAGEIADYPELYAYLDGRGK